MKAKRKLVFGKDWHGWAYKRRRDRSFHDVHIMETKPPFKFPYAPGGYVRVRLVEVRSPKAGRKVAATDAEIAAWRASQ